MMSNAVSTGMSLGPNKYSGMKKNTKSANTHNALVNQLSPTLKTSMLCKINERANTMLKATVKPASQNQART